MKLRTKLLLIAVLIAALSAFYFREHKSDFVVDNTAPQFDDTNGYVIKARQY